MDSIVTIVNNAIQCTVYLRVAQRVNLKYSHPKEKKFVTVSGDKKLNNLLW